MKRREERHRSQGYGYRGKMNYTVRGRKTRKRCWRVACLVKGGRIDREAKVMSTTGRERQAREESAGSHGHGRHSAEEREVKAMADVEGVSRRKREVSHERCGAAGEERD